MSAVGKNPSTAYGYWQTYKHIGKNVKNFCSDKSRIGKIKFQEKSQLKSISDKTQEQHGK